MQKEWVSLAKCIRNEQQAQPPASAKRYQFLAFQSPVNLFYTVFIPLSFAFSTSGPAVEGKTETIQRAINRHVAYYVSNIHDFHTTFYLTQVLQYVFFPPLACDVSDSVLRVNLGRRCWTNTGLKQRSWKGEDVCCWGAEWLKIVILNVQQ